MFNAYRMQFAIASALLCVGTKATGQVQQCEVGTLVASDGGVFDQFGNSVSVSGDVAVIGKLADDVLGSSSGSAYVYRFNGSSWVEEQKLLASDGTAGDQFGRCVSVCGDVVLVGADRDDDNGDDVGSVYVYRFNGSSWVEEQKLLASDGAVDDFFGRTVAVSGDVAMVGATGNDSQGNNSGSVYVYRFDGTTWMEMQKLLSADGDAFDQFGASVAISEDVAIIAAVRDNVYGWLSGSAYIFRLHPGQQRWAQEQKLLPSDGAAFDLFGSDVAVSGDVAIVGAWLDDDNGDRSGSAYTYRFNGSMWVEEQKILASDGAELERFGTSVAVCGDVALVGAQFGGDSGSNFGSAYVFLFNGSSWAEEQELLPAPSSFQWSDFGFSVAMSGGVAVVGAPYDDPNGVLTGSAYAFSGLADCNANAVLDCHDILNGFSVDANADGIPDECACPYDINGDGEVNAIDLVALLETWRPNGGPPGNPWNGPGHGVVNVPELLALIDAWGPCP